MQLGELLYSAGIEASLSERVRACEITGVVCDSRLVRAGSLFVALRGLHRDGACYVAEALSRGAAFVVCERELEGENCLRVDNARLALAWLCSAWHRHPARDMRMIGVTGTNGKTSVASMLYHVLCRAGHKVGLIGTVANLFNGEKLTIKNADALANMTTPDPVELYAMLAKMRDNGVEYVVMEVTSHALNFDKTAPISFLRGIFTNLTADHLDLHGDMEEYYLQKRKLFAGCEMAILSHFTPYGKRLSDELDCPQMEISPRTVEKIELHGAEGVSFLLGAAGKEKIKITLPVPGDFSVENAALAATTALSLGVEAQVVALALAGFPGVPGRMERICENPLEVSIFIDYAHTPDALEKLLKTVRGFIGSQQRIMLLFDCGGDRDRGKRRKMGSIASRLADFLVLTADNSRGEQTEQILEAILRGVDKEKPYVVIKDRKEAIAYAVREVRRGDVLLLAGKGHEEYEIRGRERLPFSEREIVAECMQRRLSAEGYEN